ncbi:hypothetical protein OPIT5_25580 [Opitutaceae bacterium TAV5]|nr:hypothetical protein OPIT5_25580 [Opitutaceae bacterium TAV5]
MKKIAPLLTLLLCMCSALFAAADNRQRVIIADFEDVGTWRAAHHTGQKPGVWFSGGTWMGTSLAAPAFADDRSGELRFAFAEHTDKPRVVVYRREKMSRMSGFLDGIEFDADSRGHPVRLRFVLLDSTRKSHWTPAVRLGEAGWRRYRVTLDAANWPDVSKVKFPASVEQVILEAEAACEGSVFMDDLALTGTFPRKNQLSVTPVYSTINYDPDRPVTIGYRVRNARPEPLTVTFSASLRTAADAAGDTGFPAASAPGVPSGATLTRTLDLPAHGQTRVSLDFGILPLGAYSVRLQAEASNDKRIAADYDDSFGVFVPNGSRLNTRPMWFGVQDTTPWNNPAENALHLDWMRAIGIDINRLGISGHRFMPEAPASIEAWRPLIEPFEKAGIYSVVLFGDTPPSLIRNGDYRQPPGDLAAFQDYAAGLGRFLGEYPHIRYLEFWNEPDIDFYHGTLDEYWAMLAAFSRGFRSTAPQIRITTGGATVSHPREKPGFNQGLYSQHGDLYDLAAFHSHGPLSNYTTRHRQVETWLAGAGLEKRLANTESGERSAYEPRGYFEQAVTLVKKLAWSKSRPNSEFHIWFTLQDYWDMDTEADDSFGLITSDNRAKPSLVAYNELIRQLANTTPASQPSFRQPGIDACEFLRDDGKRVLVCWASDGGSGGALWIRPGGQPVQKIDIFGGGETLPGDTDHVVAVGKTPLYLVSTGPAPLAFLTPDQRELDAPAEIFRDAAAPASLAVTVRNTAAADSAAAPRLLTLRDAAGAVVATGKRVVAPGATERMTLTLPVPPAAPASSGPDTLQTRRYTLELADVATNKTLAVLPVVAHDSYPVARASATAGANAPVLVLRMAGDVTELTFDPTIPAWRGPDDLSAEARIIRDADAVVFLVDVTDDKHVQSGHPDSEVWRADSVQIAFYNPANAAHTLFDAALVDGNRPVVWCHRNADPARRGLWAPADVPRTVRREGNHTRYEIRVPFALLGLAAADIPPEGLPVRFSFLVNEDDGQGRVRWIRWRGGLGDNEDISRLGHAILK